MREKRRKQAVHPCLSPNHVSPVRRGKTQATLTVPSEKNPFRSLNLPVNPSVSLMLPRDG